MFVSQGMEKLPPQRIHILAYSCVKIVMKRECKRPISNGIGEDDRENLQIVASIPPK